MISEDVSGGRVLWWTEGSLIGNAGLTVIRQPRDIGLPTQVRLLME